MDEKKLIVEAKALRQLVIKERIASLKANIAQTEASKLHNEARNLQHEVMTNGYGLNHVALEGVPDTFNVLTGGDNEEAKDRIAKLEAMQETKNPLEGQDWIQIEIDGKPMQIALAEMKERIFPVEDVTKMITKGRKEEEIPVGEAVDMTPWDSSTE